MTPTTILRGFSSCSAPCWRCYQRILIGAPIWPKHSRTPSLSTGIPGLIREIIDAESPEEL